jgi:hypothetical protein
MHARVMLVVFVMLLGLSAVAQQVRFDNTVLTTVSGGLGYENPGLMYRPAVEVEGDAFLIRGEAGIGSARKRETGDGWQRRMRADAYVKIRKFLIGGGAASAKQFTSRWSKGSVHPLVGGGIQHKNLRMLASYLLKGTDDRNGVTGVNIQARVQLSRHFSISPEVTLNRFHSTDRPDLGRKSGMSAGMGVTYSFGNTGELPRQ